MATRVPNYTNQQVTTHDDSDEDYAQRRIASGTHPEEFFEVQGNDTRPLNPVDPLSKVLAEYLKLVVDGMVRNIYTQSSIIILSAGVSGTVHYFASEQSPLLRAVTDTSVQGSVTLAKYVGLGFLIKTALEPLHNRFRIAEETRTDLINSHVISYLTPVALTWIVAYTKGISVKSLEGTLYLLGTFGLMKLLGKGYDYALDKYENSSRTSLRKID